MNIWVTNYVCMQTFRHRANIAVSQPFEFWLKFNSFLFQRWSYRQLPYTNPFWRTMLARRSHDDLNDFLFLLKKVSNITNCDITHQNIEYLNRNNNTIIAIYEGNLIVYGQNKQIERQNKQNMWCCLLPKKETSFCRYVQKAANNFYRDNCTQSHE